MFGANAKFCALKASDACGTRSILDIEKVSDSQGACVTCPLPSENLMRIFNTRIPTRKLVESVLLAEKPMDFWEDDYDMFEDFWETIGRGESRYLILYDGEEPSEIFFVGWLFI